MFSLKDVIAAITGFLLLSALGAVLYFLITSWIKKTWPAQIPRDLEYEHELNGGTKVRVVAEKLAERFKDFNCDDVICLGPVRGNAGRVLFHAGPKNTGHNANIHRNDYVLHVERLGKNRIALRLRTNESYSYFRAKRSEVEVLVKRLHEAFDSLTEI